MADWRNKLYFGDNLPILREHVADESVDLIYLDPPFNSNATYNVLFREPAGDLSSAQIKAFDDTWHWSIETEAAYEDVVTSGPRGVADLLAAMRGFLGRNDVMAYLTMMAERIIELHRVLKPGGSIHLHCDPTAGHYLRLLMDAAFGTINFRSAIIWKRTSAHNDASRLGRVYDIILFYVRDGGGVWNPAYQPYDEGYVESHYRRKTPEGRRYRTDNATARGLTGGGYEYEWNGVTNIWRYPKARMQELHDQGRLRYTRNGTPEYIRYLDEMPGMPLQNVWTDIKPINSQAKERLGYPTQKPEALLERIVNASSDEGDVVLDPFCGCGTAIAVAERLNRRWIGVDITHLAVSLMKHRLADSFGERLSPYDVVGVPQDAASARALAEASEHDGRYQFEYWALGLVEARPAHDRRRGADAGVDGYVNFFDDDSGKPKRVIAQVKSGKVERSQIAALNSDRQREGAEMALFITLERPTAPMLREAASAGFYEPRHFPGQRYPRVQIAAIEDLLSGARPDIPRLGLAGDPTFRRAPRRESASGPVEPML